jgi:uncharacterized protein (TIGR00251 family)
MRKPISLLREKKPNGGEKLSNKITRNIVKSYDMLLKVTVHPESQEDRVEMIAADACEVYVRAGAQNGRANKAVAALLAKKFGTSVRLVSGGARRHKIFKIGK